MQTRPRTPNSRAITVRPPAMAGCPADPEQPRPEKGRLMQDTAQFQQSMRRTHAQPGLDASSLTWVRRELRFCAHLAVAALCAILVPLTAGAMQNLTEGGALSRVLTASLIVTLTGMAGYASAAATRAARRIPRRAPQQRRAPRHSSPDTGMSNHSLPEGGSQHTRRRTTWSSITN